MRTGPIVAIAVWMLSGAAGALAAYQERVVTDGGSISGAVRVTGEIPALPPQPVYKHVDVCGAGVSDERLLAGANGALRNVVVSLVDVSSGKQVPAEPVVLDNVKCAFVPHVVAATLGQTLAIKNSDPFLHDAHVWLGTRTLFNVAVPKGRTVQRTLDAAGLAHINCNVRHTWMHAYVFIGDNPYHAVTGADGSFALTDVPPGTYTLSVWHELLGSSERSVTVESGKNTRVEIDLPASAIEAKEEKDR